METEVDVQTALSCCFATSSSCSHSSVLWSGGDRSILASAALALHIALTFSFGSPANAGGANSTGNIVNNRRARFIRTSDVMKHEQENLLVVSRFPRFEKTSAVFVKCSVMSALGVWISSLRSLRQVQRAPDQEHLTRHESASDETDAL